MEILHLMTFEDRAGLRRWLEENHGRERECWVACYRGKTALAGALPYAEVVMEALCFGWIDSTVKKMPDAGRSALPKAAQTVNIKPQTLNLKP